jgi:hypothetical protein
MKSWTIVLCEGAHDQQALAALASTCGGWTKLDNVPTSLPDNLAKAYPNPKPPRKLPGRWTRPQEPTYLTKERRYLEIRNREGLDNVLGQTAVDFVRLLSPTPHAVAVVVDANDKGVKARVDAFRDSFRNAFSHADNVEPGGASGSRPRLGLWVAPDNRRNGSMDDLLLKVARCANKRLVATGRRFATSLEKIKPDDWTKHRNKAILGAIYQVVEPGASLAVALRESNAWFDPGIASVRPFMQLLDFLETLTAP